MQFILHKITAAYKSKLPFVAYNKPNESNIFGVFQKDASLHTITTDFNQSGFIFAPFDAKNDAILLPKNQSFFEEQTINLDLKIVRVGCIHCA